MRIKYRLKQPHYAHGTHVMVYGQDVVITELWLVGEEDILVVVLPAVLHAKPYRQTYLRKG